MKKIESKNLEDLFFPYLLIDSFSEAIAEIRFSFQIPVDGFTAREEESIWFRSVLKPEGMKAKFLSALEEKMKQFGMSNSLRQIFEEHVLFDSNVQIFEKRYDSTCDIDDVADIKMRETDQIGETEREWRISELPYVKLFVSNYVSKDSFIKFVKSHWDEIEKLLKLQAKEGRQKIKKVNDKKVMLEIWRLNKLKKKEIAEDGEEYKETAIARIVNKKYRLRYKPASIKSILDRLSSQKKAAEKQRKIATIK